MSFPRKLFKNKQKEQEENKQKHIKRLSNIIEDVNELFQQRGVNYYEAMDVISNLQNQLNTRIAQMLRDYNKKILELKKNDQSES